MNDQNSWAVRQAEGPAGDLHALELPATPRRAVWLLEATRPAVVLGSTQPASLIDAGRASSTGIDVAHRHSGGGAVLVVPGDVCWIDLLVPRGDVLWDDDVGRAAHWVGDAWGRALAVLGVDASVHKAAMVRTAWSAMACFAGLGPGEVVGDRGKVVGIAQRRTRDVARFQCAALIRWDPAALVALFAAPLPADPAELDDAGQATGLPPAALVEALLAALPS